MKTNEKIIQLRIEGKSYDEISKTLKISKPTISYHCIKHGINKPINEKIIITEKNISEINEFYKNHTIKETAQHFNLSRTTVIKYCDNKHKLFTDIENKERNYRRVKNRRNKLKEMAVEYLGGKCVKCGYNECIWALEFHHKDPNEKDFTISTYTTLGWEKLKKELDKCELRCSNCHKEIHYRDVFPLSDKQ
jgi:DNA-binding CsgD family transcriptional regulator